MRIGFADHVYTCIKCGAKFHGNWYDPMGELFCDECRKDGHKKKV